MTTFFSFIFDEGWEDPNTTISGLSGDPDLYSYKTLYLSDFSGGGGGGGRPPVPPLDPHMFSCKNFQNLKTGKNQQTTKKHPKLHSIKQRVLRRFRNFREGGPGQSDKKALTTFFFSPQLILQKSNA